MMTPRSWTEVLSILRSYSPGTSIKVPKGMLPHPTTFAMQPSMGLPAGQVGDYRRQLVDGAGLHARDYGGYYLVHIDRVHPAVNPVEHLRRDAPGVFVASSAVVGSAVGGLIGRSKEAALAGAAIAGVAGLIVAFGGRGNGK